MGTSLFFVFLLFLCSSFALSPSVSSTDCGKTKSCFRSPDSCSGTGCTYFVSWKAVNISGVTNIEFELAGTVKSTGYISVGFSSDMKMGNDGVIGCIATGPTIRTAYNPAYYNQFVNAPGHLVVSSGTLLGGAFSANFLSCRFRRPASPASNAAQLKDLSSPNKYYILISRGDSVNAGGLGKHFGGGHTVTSSNYDLSANTFASGGQASFPLIKVHGILMMIAWLMLSSIGVVMARGYKAMWPDKRWCHEKIWFQVHRTMQLGCVLCTVVGFVLIFVQIGGYSMLTTLPAMAHPILGIVVTVLALINPIMAIFRPTPDAKRRPIFNWAHFAVGTAAQIFAVASIFIGVKLNKAGNKFTAAPAPFWVVVAHTVFSALMEIAFAVNTARIRKCSQASGAPNVPVSQSKKSACLLHQVLLGFHVIVVTGLTLFLVIFLIMN